MNEKDAITKARLTIFGKESLILDKHPSQPNNPQQREFARWFTLPVESEIDVTDPQIAKKGSKWFVKFNRVSAPDIILCPNYIIVEIDDLTGEAKLLLSP